MSDLVGTPNGWFSHAQAHLCFLNIIKSQLQQTDVLQEEIGEIGFLFSKGDQQKSLQNYVKRQLQ